MGRGPDRQRRRAWTAAEDAAVRAAYPHERTADVAARIDRTALAVYQRAEKLGVKKTAVYLASPAACRLRREASPRSIACRFPKGHVPANKGLRRPGWHRGRMQDTQFKPGVRQGIAAKNWRPVGTVISDADGYLRIKVREAMAGEATGFGNVRVWPMMQRHVWSQANGPIPAGHNVVFKDGDRKHCTLDNLELVSRTEMMRRNTIHNLPAPLKDAIRTLGRLKRQIRKREKHHGQEQDRRPA